MSKELGKIYRENQKWQNQETISLQITLEKRKSKVTLDYKAFTEQGMERTLRKKYI